jgi:hypothetical protein
MRALTVDEIDIVSGGEGRSGYVPPPPPQGPYHFYLEVGGGAFGYNAGMFYSRPTGAGMYFGFGTPGPSLTVGVSDDPSSILVGWGASSQFMPNVGFSTGLPTIDFSAYQVGTPGANFTFGLTFEQVGTKFLDTVQDWLNQSQIGKFYNLISHPGSTTGGIGNIGLNFDNSTLHGHRQHTEAFRGLSIGHIQSGLSFVVLGANYQEPRPSELSRFAHM